MSVAGLEIVGRDEELAELLAFLDGVGSVPAAFVVEGDAGIGKTTLWDRGVATARARGHVVLASAPAGFETQLSFAVLRDLLEPVFDRTAPDLPVPQRRALEVVPLRADVGARPPAAGAIAAALLALLRVVAREGPLLVAIDDVQWVDAASADALEFACRRLFELPVGLLLARRTDPLSSPPGRIERTLPRDRTGRLQLGPLGIGALRGVLGAHGGETMPRPTLRRIHATSGGNPFYALELARALERRGIEVVPGEPLPLPPSLREIVRDRISALPRGARTLLVATAALPDPRLELVRHGAALHEEFDASLDAVIDAGVVVLEQHRLRFAHPCWPRRRTRRPARRPGGRCTAGSRTPSSTSSRERDTWRSRPPAPMLTQQTRSRRPANMRPGAVRLSPRRSCSAKRTF